jgi:hypothetical protein
MNQQEHKVDGQKERKEHKMDGPIGKVDDLICTLGWTFTRNAEGEWMIQ